jgi:hypothetical protein
MALYWRLRLLPFFLFWWFSLLRSELRRLPHIGSHCIRIHAFSWPRQQLWEEWWHTSWFTNVFFWALIETSSRVFFEVTTIRWETLRSNTCNKIKVKAHFFSNLLFGIRCGTLPRYFSMFLTKYGITSLWCNRYILN